MAEDSDLEKTEPASPRRLEQARERGQIARSRELSTFTVTVSAGIAFLLIGPTMVQSLEQLVRKNLTFDHQVAFDTALMVLRFKESAVDSIMLMLPFIAIMAGVAFVSPIAVSGWLFSAQALAPKWGSLNPFSGVKRIFSVMAAVEGTKAVAKSLLIGGIAVAVLWNHRMEYFGLLSMPLEQGLAYFAHLATISFLLVATGLIIVAVIDVPFQLWNHAKQLRMTKEEVRQEMKESEGDPHVKARIRSIQREMAQRRMMAEVPKADVIVTNPTHFAVALRYAEGEMRAPVVVAKGATLIAERIRAIAEDEGIPVVRIPPLARALYRHAEIGDEIPAALYTAVAEVLAWVYQLRVMPKGRLPEPPEGRSVPPNMDPGEAAA